MNSMTAKSSTPARKPHVSPWAPNQHGAWSMLIGPAIVATVALLVALIKGASPEPGLAVIALICIIVAWLMGYFTFFAFGLWVKARNPKRRHLYAKPVEVYGPICAVACIIAVLLYPRLMVWAIPFAILISVAVFETWRGRPRSLLSGFSTTVASAFIIPAVLHLVTRPAGPIFAVTIFIALYHFSTTMYVKSVIRKRGDKKFRIASVSYHVACLVAALVAAFLCPKAYVLLCPVVMAAALYRAIRVPSLQDQGRTFTARQIGMWEVPITITAYVLALWGLIDILL